MSRLKRIIIIALISIVATVVLLATTVFSKKVYNIVADGIGSVNATIKPAFRISLKLNEGVFYRFNLGQNDGSFVLLEDNKVVIHGVLVSGEDKEAITYSAASGEIMEFEETESMTRWRFDDDGQISDYRIIRVKDAELYILTYAQKTEDLTEEKLDKLYRLLNFEIAAT